MKKITKFQIVTGDCTSIIAKGFSSYMAARDWILAHDYGQYEENGGWYIYSYTE